MNYLLFFKVSGEDYCFDSAFLFGLVLSTVLLPLEGEFKALGEASLNFRSLSNT
jgi:hypothetical protein